MQYTIARAIDSCNYYISTTKLNIYLLPHKNSTVIILWLTRGLTKTTFIQSTDLQAMCRTGFPWGTANPSVDITPQTRKQATTAKKQEIARNLQYIHLKNKLQWLAGDSIDQFTQKYLKKQPNQGLDQPENASTSLLWAGNSHLYCRGVIRRTRCVREHMLGARDPFQSREGNILQTRMRPHFPLQLCKVVAVKAIAIWQ